MSEKTLVQYAAGQELIGLLKNSQLPAGEKQQLTDAAAKLAKEAGVFKINSPAIWLGYG